jgi:excinuclease ABC subunit A
MSEKNEIIIKGARENNLKNIDVAVPKNKLVVMTGVSGSGKSSLAFDTIYAEGQRRYIESLSSYARMFLGNVDKPDVDSIEGLSPAISIDQKTTNRNPRSTVGTVTELYDYLRLLYARIGRPTCPTHHIEISSQTIEQMTQQVLSYPEGSILAILSPIAENRKGTFEKTIEMLRKDGYSKAEIDGEMMDLDEEITLDKNKKHNVFVVIDRLKIKLSAKSRIYESLEAACNLSDGRAFTDIDGKHVLFSEHYRCPYCDFTIGKLEPNMFSFNSPLGACPTCHGLGFVSQVDPNLLVVNEDLSIAEGAVRYLKNIVFTDNIEWQVFKKLFDYYQIDVFKKFKDYTEEERKIILYGTDEPISYEIHSSGGIVTKKNKPIEGLIPLITRRYQETTSNMQRDYYATYMKDSVCPTCHGQRLSDSVLSVLIGGKSIFGFTQMSVMEALSFLDGLNLTSMEQKIGALVLKEIRSRLSFLKNVGLEYLTLSRSAATLSGGEAQRIRLATQIGSQLSGVLYVLDEPSIGLHERDNQKLIHALKDMRDLGNSLIVVEHDEEIMKECDYIIDVGPYAGIHGGEIVAEGTPEEMKLQHSITADFLAGRRKILLPEKRRAGNQTFLTIHNAHANNLKNIDVKIPLGELVLVTGVSGSGKSTLVNDIICNYLNNKLYRSHLDVGAFDSMDGADQIERLINIDQSPIGRTPRSNPATYTGVFDDIRDLFTQTIEAKRRGYTKSRFSFNVKGGRCETCGGDGIIRISMNFLPDVYVPCEACHGTRYNSETLEVKFKDKSIADVLAMTVEEACSFFENIPSVYEKIKTLNDVGLGYIKLGQPATTLSGGEAQRVKLASELHKKISGKTLFILDEPTTGLHSYDVEKLVQILERMVDAGATVLVIEHNLDVIKMADWIIDLGPNGGDDGGRVIAEGTPEDIAKNPNSVTGPFIQRKLEEDKTLTK